MRKQLADIDVAFVEVGAAVEVGVLLGSAQIAFGEADKALVAFRLALDRKPNHTLRKLDHSPKVLAVWKKADGQVE